MIAGDSSLKHPVTLSRMQWAGALLIGAWMAIALAVVFAFQPIQEPIRLEAGQVSPRAILAPEHFTFPSSILTREARSKVETQVQPVYDPPDANFAREQVRFAARVFDHLDSVRADPYTNSERKLEWVNSIPNVIVPSFVVSQTLMLDEGSYRRIVTETLYVLDVTMRDEIRSSDLLTESAKLASRVSLALAADQANLVVEWAKAFVIPNSFYNPQKTAEQRALALARLGTVYRTIEKGEAIVREGEVVTPLALEALEQTGLVRPRLVLADYIGPALFAVLLVALLAIYVWRLRPALARRPRVLGLIAFLILFFAIGIKLAAPNDVLLYLYPVSAAAMLLAVLVDAQAALGAALILAFTTGFFAHDSFEGISFALAGGAIAALSLGRIERLQAFLWSGTYVAIANAAVIAAFRIVARDFDWVSWGEALVIALANGALSGLIALGSLFVLGKLFGITTPLELLDLSRPTHPLLQKLLIEAPGTYHHSLIVGHLAEQAAHRIGADALLVRVGAYYHDVGKTYSPPSFVENQLDGVNVHDTLTPQASASIVINHVPHGLALAKKYGLPERLREFIPQHHGTTLAAYFHRMATKANSDTPIDEKDFRYPGPKPQSRETAILMLADGVEATTRAERPATPEQIRATIERIVNERLRDGQLDESDLTLRDLQQIKVAFFGVLQGLFHPRVRYPEAPPEKVEGAVNSER